MSEEPVSRIYKTHSQIKADIESDDTGLEISCLAAFLKEVLLRNEADLKTITRWIQSKKRLIKNEAAALDINDTNRKVLLDEFNHLESLRQQLLTTFLGKQAAYQNLMTAEQELAKRYDQENGDHKPTAVTSPNTRNKSVNKKNSRSPRRR